MLAKNVISTKVIIALALAAMLAFSMMATAMAKQPGIAARGNALSSVAEPVDITAEDISAEMCSNGEDVRYYAVQHNLGETYGVAENIVWREPARLGGKNVEQGPQASAWNTLYLGVSGPECGDIAHKGQVTVYYDFGDDGWYSITAQFNGKGELISVNGVPFE